MSRARFGAYEILHELKSGGMGAVLLGRRRGPGAFEQLVAIKTIRPEFATTPAVRAMFLDEAAILARIYHPGIATVHDFGEEGGTLYMVMEYVAGIPFRDLPALGPPPLVCARAIAEACRGLHAAHELRDLSGTMQGLVHRDISPDNLLLGFDGHVKLIDFGIALVKKGRQAPVTELGTIKGKPPYMSPEQVANEAMDRRSDVFSLGVVLWELLAHRQLFEGDSIYHIAIAVQQQPIASPSHVLGRPLPLGLDAVVMNALERDPARRTQTAAELAEQLEHVIQGGSGETLEAWAARTLGEQREQHISWLAGVVAGELPLPKVVGRASGQVTELAPLGAGHPQQAPIAVTPVQAEPPSKTSIGGTALDDLSVPPRNRLAPIAIALLALVAVGGGVAYLMTRAPAHAVVTSDAVVEPRVVDAREPDASPPQDAAPDAAAIIDLPVDGGTRHTALRPDARPNEMRPDAGVTAPTPRGSGIITIKYKPGPYANIAIDGVPVPSPVFNRKIPSGHHTISFSDPATGATLDTQSVDVADGDKVEVNQR